MRRSPSPVSSLVLAGTCWGSSYAVVELIDGANPMLVTGARFALFGAVAAVLLRTSGGFRNIPWRIAVLHAVGGSVGLYLSEVTAISLAGAGPTIAVVGSIPVVYALVGARRDGAPVRPLAPSVALTVAAHVIIHRDAWPTDGRGVEEVLLGLAVASLGVVGFCAYASHSTDHLRSRPDIGPERWSSAIGVASGLCAVPLLAVGLLGGLPTDPGSLLTVAFFLAVVPSWLATSLWNRAVVDVPRALAGQLLVFEPLSAFVFVHLVSGAVPGPTLVIGELLLLAGALLAVRAVRQPLADTGPSVEADPARMRPGVEGQPDIAA
jgi:drug/metabolite transporter (DMT)-like permease